MFFLFVLYSLAAASIAAAENQAWIIRPGDNLEIISATLDIPKEEIKKQNPGVLETNLQIGQKLKLPFVSHGESKRLAQVVSQKDVQIAALQKANGELEKNLASSESQLFWYPIWFWGFWLCFTIIAFIVAGAYWIFRQTHPQVFDQPHQRSIKDLKYSQTRVRSSFSDEEENAGSRGGQWHPPLRRLPHGR